MANLSIKVTDRGIIDYSATRGDVVPKNRICAKLPGIIACYPGSGSFSDKCMQTMDPLPLTVSE